MAKIQLPHNFTPRPYQKELLKAFDEGVKRAVACWHRRAGKDKTFINLVAREAMKRVGIYFYFLPSYAQGKKIIWDGIDGHGFRFLDHFPAQIIRKKNEQEMKLTLVNGSIVQIVGTDNIDSIVGTNPVGVIFSEYSLQNPHAWDYIRPILRENGGWALFNFTPRGKNHAFDLYEMARSNPEWFVSLLSVDATGVLTPADIQEERDAGMSEELIQQEFYVSFNAIQDGAYYARQIQQAEDQDRITAVPYEPRLKVDTWWDLGVGDATSIWFTQTGPGGLQIRVIDYYEMQGEGFPHYAKVLAEKGYVYGQHNGPHDLEVRELGTGKSRIETAKSLGLNFRTVPNLGVDDGIEAARSILASCWFDKDKCKAGLNALKSYHKAFDEKRKVWLSHPYHDWSSHAADAFRYFAVGHKPPTERKPLKYPNLGVI